MTMRVRSQTLRRWGMVLGLLGGLPASSVWAESSYHYTLQSESQETQYKSPEDLLDKIPFLADMPRSMAFGDGFKMRLSTRELQIDHMGSTNRTPPTQNNCLFGFSYVTPVAGFFTYRLDLPLAHADRLIAPDWSRSSMGDYVVYLSRTPVDHPTLKLLLSARF